MTAYFTPTDLRTEDPRPSSRATEPDESVVRELLSARLNGADLTTALRALGLEPYERATPPVPRDAYTKPRPEKPERAAARTAPVCRNGHDRKQHSFIDRRGAWYCVACQTARADAMRARRSS